MIRINLYINYCECGCGGIAKPGNRLIYHHVRKDRPSAFKGKKHSDEAKASMSENKKGKKTWNTGLSKETDERVKQYSEDKKGTKRETFSEEWKAALSESKIGNKAFLGHKQSEYQKKRASETHKGRVKSELELRNWFISCQTRPNKPETKILELLNELYPNEWEYTGDGTKIIAGKNPDFTHKEKKLLIEMFGDYWHRGQNPEDRINIFKPHGYSTLVIWESELKEDEVVRNKILKFYNG